MKRSPTVLLLLTFASISVGDAHWRTSGDGGLSRAFAGKRAIPCPRTLNDITDCPDTGCGPSLDPYLNRQKNIRSDDQTAEVTTVQGLKNLPDLVSGFEIGDSREKLRELGEGKKVTVVAFALVARKGSRESCNCALTAPADTDNMIVLVNPSGKPTLAKDEGNSVSAELTPRVRLDHPGLAGAKLQPLITAAGGALLVRVTGLQMFDSEHSFGYHLKRQTNWEIHPVLALEYCPKGKKCTADSNIFWKNLED